MSENIHDFLYQMIAIITFIVASILYVFIINATNQMKEGFTTAYKSQGVICEADVTNGYQVDEARGSDIIFSIYYGLEYPIRIDETEIPLNIDVGQFDFSIINSERQYKRLPLINDKGIIIKIHYY